MPVEIVMPKLGLTMTEALIVEWVKNEGDQVGEGEVLFVLETEKVSYEVEATESGVLGRIIAHEQDTVPVGGIVAYLLRPGEDPGQLPGSDIPAPTFREAQGEMEGGAGRVDEPPAAPAPSGERVRATPLAKKIAREHGIDLSGVVGGGHSGRVVRDDVERLIREGGGAEVGAVSGRPAGVGGGPESPEAQEGELVKFTTMRRVIARNMLASKTEAALAYMSISVDATRIQELRAILLPYHEARRGVRITITDIIMKITGAAIKQHPVVNTRWTDEGVLYIEAIHMGMAMALDEGLIVPVIRNIDEKSIVQIALERAKLVQKGRESSYTPDDIKGSTFTLSSLGMYGIESFTAIVNQPENAILAVGAIIASPVVVAGEVVVRPMMNCTLTYDHRTIDGAEAAKFCMTLKEMMESPQLLL